MILTTFVVILVVFMSLRYIYQKKKEQWVN